MARCKSVFAALVAIAALAFAQAAHAAPMGDKDGGATGAAIGIFLGQPTGLTFRYGLGKSQSIEAKAAWNFSADSSFCAQANWLLEFPGVLVIQGIDFPLYVGAGAQVNLGSATSVGIRLPVGVVYRFAKAPIELNLELGLGMQLFPATEFTGSGGLGIRYRL
jgi:hypothetical protein